MAEPLASTEVDRGHKAAVPSHTPSHPPHPADPPSTTLTVVHNNMTSAEAVLGASDECVVCFHRACNAKLLPCGHDQLCSTCAEKLLICPLCRAHIEAHLDVRERACTEVPHSGEVWEARCAAAQHAATDGVGVLGGGVAGAGAGAGRGGDGARGGFGDGVIAWRGGGVGRVGGFLGAEDRRVFAIWSVVLGICVFFSGWREWMSALPSTCEASCRKCIHSSMTVGGCLVCKQGYINAGRSCYARPEDLPRTGINDGIGAQFYGLLVLLTQIVTVVSCAVFVRRLQRQGFLAQRAAELTVRASFGVQFVRMLLFDAVILSAFLSPYNEYKYYVVNTTASAARFAARTATMASAATMGQTPAGPWGTRADAAPTTVGGVSSPLTSRSGSAFTPNHPDPAATAANAANAAAAAGPPWQSEDYFLGRMSATSPGKLSAPYHDGCFTAAPGTPAVDFDPATFILGGHNRLRTSRWILGGEAATMVFCAALVMMVADILFIMSFGLPGFKAKVRCGLRVCVCVRVWCGVWP